MTNKTNNVYGTLFGCIKNENNTRGKSKECEKNTFDRNINESVVFHLKDSGFVFTEIEGMFALYNRGGDFLGYMEYNQTSNLEFILEHMDQVITINGKNDVKILVSNLFPKKRTIAGRYGYHPSNHMRYNGQQRSGRCKRARLTSGR